MFTGLIEATAAVLSKEAILLKHLEVRPFSLELSPESISHYRIKVAQPKDFQSCKVGDSIAVNGCCLTLVPSQGEELSFDLSHETWNLTAFKTLKIGDEVNLERAMLLNQRLDGHIVTGHVDGVGKVLAVKKDGELMEFSVQIPLKIGEECILKGSVAINGVSLTINKLVDDEAASYLTLNLIPHTLSLTNLKFLQPGNQVHIETDLIGKYALRGLSKIRRDLPGLLG